MGDGSLEVQSWLLIHLHFPTTNVKGPLILLGYIFITFLP